MQENKFVFDMINSHCNDNNTPYSILYTTSVIQVRVYFFIDINHNTIFYLKFCDKVYVE